MKEENRLFSEKLAELCENSDQVPSKNFGRNRFFEKQFSVSYETVRKWFAGESMPALSKSKKIAEILGVSVAYLLHDEDKVQEIEPLDYGRLLNAVMLVRRVETSGGYDFDEQVLGQLVLSSYKADPRNPNKTFDDILAIIKSGGFGKVEQNASLAIKAFDSLQDLVEEAKISNIALSKNDLKKAFVSMLDIAKSKPSQLNSEKTHQAIIRNIGES